MQDKKQKTFDIPRTEGAFKPLTVKEVLSDALSVTHGSVANHHIMTL